MNKISIFIAEGENHLRQAVQHLDGCLVTGAASSAESLLAQIGHQPPNVLLLDWVLPGMNPQRLLAVIRKFYPDIKIIASVLNSRDSRLAIEYGVDGCLQKGPSLEDFASSLQAKIEKLEHLEVKEE